MQVHKNGYLYIKNNDSFNVSFTVPKKNFTLRSEPDKSDDAVIEVSVTLAENTVSVCAEAIKNGEVKDLYVLSFPKVIGQRYDINYTGVTSVIAPAFISGVNFNLYWTPEDGRDIYKSSDSILQITRYLVPKEAKKLWSYIKNKGYVSRWIWDPYMGYYDCYCKACAAGKERFWLGNPWVGYVRPVNKISLAAFDYKDKYYVPCKEDEYNKVTYWNKLQYNEICKTYAPKDPTEKELKKFNEDWPDFDTLWKVDLTQEEINHNGNIRGGCYKVGSQDEKPKYVSKNNARICLDDFLEKVVTLGWHNTNPYKAIRCPVCNDLHTIMLSNGKYMLPWYLRLKSHFNTRKRWNE